MEWATAIGTSSNGMAACIVDAAGVHAAPLAALFSKGLPTAASARVMVDQSMSEWREVQPNEYLSAFEITSNADFENLHAVYETAADDLRILVPALAVMRAFFRPAHYCLSKMFLPEGLDAVRYLNTDFEPPRVELLSKRCRTHATYGDVVTPIAWMSFFPSAMRFASSVHRHACSGRLALDLPQARAKLTVRGQLQKDVLHVTSLYLCEIDALENPLPWASAHTSVIFRRPMPDALHDDVPTRFDGRVELTDEEWLRIQPIVVRRKRRIGLDQRKVLNGVLTKLARGTSWRNTRYTEGNVDNAQQAYRDWKLAGIWNQVLNVLRETRARERHSAHEVSACI